MKEYFDQLENKIKEELPELLLNSHEKLDIVQQRLNDELSELRKKC